MTNMIINNIDDLLPAIAGREEFKVIHRDGYKAIDYLYVDETSFDDPRRLECRGIKFHTNGDLMSRPFHKFFNIGERQHSTEIDFDQPHVVTDKLDGSMIHPAFVNGKLVLMTRKGITDVANKAAAQFLAIPKYYKFMLACVEEDATPIFEYTSPHNRIVIRYKEPALTLVALRDNHTGDYLDTDHLAGTMDIPCVVKYPVIEDIGERMVQVRRWVGAEGIVIRFEDGHMLKMKADAYVMTHRALDDMNSKKKILRVIFEEAVDDMLPILDPEDADELVIFAGEVRAEVNVAANAVIRAVARNTRMTRKEFALDVIPTFKPWLRPAAWAAWDLLDPRPVIHKILTRYPEHVASEWRGV